ncbi:hypothetical protein JJB98_22920 [Bradyrhizobium diazoefficiens]|nr:hypothetical protein [Bradyrhizobium diazoefficiens]QQO22583.1 hypothetical protein JJB98_22920 [Bradyrhizobium diazoefficiens]
MLSTVRNDLRIRWMVTRFHSNCQVGSNRMKMIQERNLLGPRPHDEQFMACLDRLGDVRQKGWIVMGPARTDRVCLVAKVCGREMRVDDAGTNAGQSHLKDLGDHVIYPDHSTIVPFGRLRLR